MLWIAAEDACIRLLWNQSRISNMDGRRLIALSTCEKAHRMHECLPFVEVSEILKWIWTKVVGKSYYFVLRGMGTTKSRRRFTAIIQPNDCVLAFRWITDSTKMSKLSRTTMCKMWWVVGQYYHVAPYIPYCAVASSLKDSRWPRHGRHGSVQYCL